MSYTETRCPLPGHRAFTDGVCNVLVGHEPIGPGGSLRWHLSISHPFRYPTWDEIKAARYNLLPDNMTMAMLLPPSGEYVNLHPNCFHLHEIDEPRIIT